METISSKLLNRAHTCGQAPAVIYDDLTLNWAELSNLSLQASTLLRQHGIKKGTHVAFLCTNRPAYLIGWFGLANIGAVTVSLNTALVGEGLRYAITQSDAEAIFVERSLLETNRSDIEAVLNDRALIVFDEDEGLFRQVRDLEPDAVYDGSGSDPVSIIYTSGTTGRPKGVLNCHESFLASGRWMVRSLNIVQDDRIMVFLPLFHTNPQMYAVMSALEVGCALVIRPRLSVSRFFEEARHFKCTLFTYVGTVLAMLTSRLKSEEKDHFLTRCVGGGCPEEAWEIMENRYGIKPFELYGMTEVGGWVTGNTTDEYRFGSCGLSRPDMDVEVVDEEDQPLPAGSQGEIVVRPKVPFTMFLGYWGNPKASWEASRNFWFHTGDIGKKDEDGYLYFVGRLKEIIRRGGENISPAELEMVLLDHPSIEDVAVVAVPDAIFGDEIKVAVVANTPFLPRDIVSFLDGRVPTFMYPRYIQFVQSIPRTATQKILRAPLQEDNKDVVDLYVGGESEMGPEG